MKGWDWQLNVIFSMCVDAVLVYLCVRVRNILVFFWTIKGGSRTWCIKEFLQSSVGRNTSGFHGKESQQGWMACFSCLYALLMRKFSCRKNRKDCACCAILTCAP